MHTPENAKALWCPMVRIARHESIDAVTPTSGGYSKTERQHHVVGGCNTDVMGGNRVPASCRCIAYGCAMWRWHPTTTLDQDSGKLTMAGPGGYDDRIPAKGYCGLAPLGAAA